MIKLALFDLDNTLYPTHEQVITCRKAAIKAMIKRGLKGEEKELFNKLKKIVKRLGSNNEQHFDTLVKETMKNLSEQEYLAIISQGITVYNTHKQRLMKLYKDAKPLIRKLLSKGLKVGVLTKGNPKKQWDKINRLGLYPLIGNKVWITNDDESKEKQIKEILKKFKLDKKEIILIGDRRDSDIRAAKEMGIKSVQLIRGPYKNMKGPKPDHEIKNLKELIKVFNF